MLADFFHRKHRCFDGLGDENMTKSITYTLTRILPES